MPFFLPSRLVDYEYFESQEPDTEYNEIAKDYQNEIDFAFFVVNFHYSKADYEALTLKEKAFICKAWEEKIVTDSSQIAAAAYNAITNSNRKKGKKAVPLWKKKQKKLNKQIARDNFVLIKAVEETEGKNWVDLVYKANGLTKKGGK